MKKFFKEKIPAFFKQKIPHFFKVSIPWFFTKKLPQVFKHLPKNTWNYMKKARLELVILLAILIVDIMVKYTIQWTLDPHQRVSIISGFFYITRVYNTGAAFGTTFGIQSYMTARTFLLIFTSISLVAFFIAMYRFRGKHKLARITFAMIIAGALGNFFDRLFIRIPSGQYFGVRDMFAFVLGGWAAPIFNIADVALVFGVILFAVYFIFMYRPTPKIMGPVIEKDWKWNGEAWNLEMTAGVENASIKDKKE